MSFVRRHLVLLVVALAAAWFFFFRKGAPRLSVLQGAASA